MDRVPSDKWFLRSGNIDIQMGIGDIPRATITLDFVFDGNEPNSPSISSYAMKLMSDLKKSPGI